MVRANRAAVRDMGAALAVLSIYLLTLLVPLHDAAALQSNFEKLGYETVGALSICSAINEADSQQDAPAAIHCPVAGLAKAQLSLETGAIRLEAPILRDLVWRAVQPAQAPPAYSPLEHAPPRAPPARV